MRHVIPFIVRVPRLHSGILANLRLTIHKQHQSGSIRNVSNDVIFFHSTTPRRRVLYTFSAHKFMNNPSQIVAGRPWSWQLLCESLAPDWVALLCRQILKTWKTYLFWPLPLRYYMSFFFLSLPLSLFASQTQQYTVPIKAFMRFWDQDNTIIIQTL